MDSRVANRQLGFFVADEKKSLGGKMDTSRFSIKFTSSTIALLVFSAGIVLIAPAEGYAAPKVPVVSLSADPQSIFEGESSVLNWASSNATSCTAISTDPEWDGVKPLSGSQVVSPSVTTSYMWHS